MLVHKRETVFNKRKQRLAANLFYFIEIWFI